MEVRTDNGAAPGPGDADRRAGTGAAPGSGASEQAGPDAGAAREGSRAGAAAQDPERASRTEAGPDAPGDAGAAGSAARGTAPGGRVPGHAAEAGDGSGEPESDQPGSRRPPAVTRDTARPEGGGRAASGDAPAPARQWPLLSVLALVGAGLLLVGTDAFADGVRVGTILIGAGLILGAVLRRVTPSVGMLAVRSRFTDMITYGLLGTVIVLLALMAQPKPWLDVPFLEDAVHFTVR